MDKRTIWLGLGAVVGSIAGHLLRRRFDKDHNDEDAEGGSTFGLVRAAVGGPSSVMAATGLARGAADQLSLDPEDPRAQAAVGFAIGLGLNLLAGPLRRVLPI